MKVLFPEERLSYTVTEWLSPSRVSTRWLPMKPAPPVMNAFMGGGIGDVVYLFFDSVSSL